MTKLSSALVILLLLVGCSSHDQEPVESASYAEICTLESNPDISLTHANAVAIAETSECSEIGPLEGHDWCNENYAAWWLEINSGTATKTYCVVDAETEVAVVHRLE